MGYYLLWRYHVRSCQANVYSTVLNRVRLARTLPPLQTMTINSTFSFGRGDNNMVVLKEGQPFFTSPIANECMGTLKVGLRLPAVAITGADDSVCLGYNEPYWGNAKTEILVGGGSCCDGYLMGVSPEGKLTKILAIDFNVRRIVPLIYMVPSKGPEKDEAAKLGLLVSGSGCSGYGVRFVDFNRPTPISIPVVETEEAIKRHSFWTCGGDPFSVTDIWDRLVKLGIKADKERTAMASKAFVAF